MKKIIALFLVLGLAGFIYGCGQTQTTKTGGTTGGGTSTTATITGQVAATSADINMLEFKPSALILLSFRTLGDTAVSGATITLIQVKSDGTEVATGKSATTNSSGNYTIDNVSPLTSGYYKVVAEKSNSAGTDKIRVESLAVISSATPETVNIAPESTVAVKIIEKEKSAYGANFTADQDTVKEFKNLVVDDTEKLVKGSDKKGADIKMSLPSMLNSKSGQVSLAASGITENRGNAQKAFEKIDFQNLSNQAIKDSNMNDAMKVLNQISANGYANGNESKMPPNDATRALAKALIAGNQESVSNVISYAKESVSGGNISQSVSTIVSDFNTKLANIQTNYENAVAGTTTSTNIASPEFLVFDETARKSGISSDTKLNVPQEKILKEYIENKYLNGNSKIDDVKFVQKLGYITSDLNIDTSNAHFQDINIFYGNMGGWKPVGNVRAFLPSTSDFAETTVESVRLLKAGKVVLTFEAEGSDGINWRINGNDPAFNLNNDINMTAGTTTTFNLTGTLSKGKGAFSTPVTFEVIEIPNVISMNLVDGTIVSSFQSENNISSSDITLVSDKLPTLVWSTAETDAITLPRGYQWGCFLEIYSATVSGGKVNTQQTPVFASGSDLGSLITSNSFIFPPQAELSQTDKNGNSLVYRIRLQRTLVGPSGKFAGWGTGSNANYIKYVP